MGQAKIETNLFIIIVCEYFATLDRLEAKLINKFHQIVLFLLLLERIDRKAFVTPIHKVRTTTIGRLKICSELIHGYKHTHHRSDILN